MPATTDLTPEERTRIQTLLNDIASLVRLHQRLDQFDTGALYNDGETDEATLQRTIREKIAALLAIDPNLVNTVRVLPGVTPEMLEEGIPQPVEAPPLPGPGQTKAATDADLDRAHQVLVGAVVALARHHAPDAVGAITRETMHTLLYPAGGSTAMRTWVRQLIERATLEVVADYLKTDPAISVRIRQEVEAEMANAAGTIRSRAQSRLGSMVEARARELAEAAFKRVGLTVRLADDEFDDFVEDGG